MNHIHHAFHPERGVWCDIVRLMGSHHHVQSPGQMVCFRFNSFISVHEERIGHSGIMPESNAAQLKWLGRMRVLGRTAIMWAVFVVVGCVCPTNDEFQKLIYYPKNSMSICYENYTMYHASYQWGHGRVLNDHKLIKPSITDAPGDIEYVITMLPLDSSPSQICNQCMSYTQIYSFNNKEYCEKRIIYIMHSICGERCGVI